jgi:hypothetical protein
MNPEEKLLLERSLKLSEENNQILKKMEKRFRWAMLWGFIKLAIIILPLIVGFFYIEPLLQQAVGNYSSIRELIKDIDLPL